MEINEVNCNTTSSEYSENGEGASIWTKIIGLAMYFIGCLGIILFYGIIHYEKFGQDSKKRSFPGIMVQKVKKCHTIKEFFLFRSHFYF